MLFEGTSRLSQVALAMAVAGGVLALLGFVGNNTWMGVVLLVAAGAAALATVVRDREDMAVWPAYGALGIVLLGLLMAVPMALSANGTVDVARNGRAARDAFIVRRPPLDAAMRSCVRDSATGCSAASILATAQARQEGVTASDNCTAAGEICLADAPGGNLAWKYVTAPVEGVGSLRIEETRTPANQVLDTTCRPVVIDAETELVKAACGDVPPGGPVSAG